MNEWLLGCSGPFPLPCWIVFSLLACEDLKSKLNIGKRSLGLSRWLSGKESTCQCRRCGIDPWAGKIPWGRKWQLTAVFLLGNPMDRGVWWATVHGVAESQTWLSYWACTHTHTHTHISQQQMSELQMMVYLMGGYFTRCLYLANKNEDPQLNSNKQWILKYRYAPNTTWYILILKNSVFLKFKFNGTLSFNLATPHFTAAVSLQGHHL